MTNNSNIVGGIVGQMLDQTLMSDSKQFVPTPPDPKPVPPTDPLPSEPQPVPPAPLPVPPIII